MGLGQRPASRLPRRRFPRRLALRRPLSAPIDDRPDLGQYPVRFFLNHQIAPHGEPQDLLGVLDREVPEPGGRPDDSDEGVSDGTAQH